jgi:hypothetical protein
MHKRLVLVYGDCLWSYRVVRSKYRQSGSGVRVYGAWRMWARSGHMAWHMTTLNTQTWPKGEVPSLGLTDEDVSLLWGWIVIS